MSMVWLDGQVMAESEAKVSVFDRGFLYGDSVFETIRVHNFRTFRQESHLERLAASAERVGIELPLSLADLAAAVTQTVRVNLFQEGSLRVTITRGMGGGELMPAAPPKPLVVITVREPRDLSLPMAEGVDVVVSSVRRSSPTAMPVTAKTGNYLNGILAQRDARSEGAFEALMLDEKGLLAEGTITNVFMVSDGVLATPALNGSVFPGIMRGIVLELAAKLDLVVGEGHVEPSELDSADEIWLTNSAIGILPVKSMSGRCMFPPWPTYERLLAAYSELLESECPDPYG